MKIEFVPFVAEHLVALDLPAAREWGERLVQQPKLAAAYERDGLAWTLLLDGKPAAAAGLFRVFWPDTVAGQVEVWSLFPPRLPKRVWGAVAPKIRAVLAEAEARGIYRFDAYIRADNRFGFTLADAFGFQVEAVMERWGPMDADTLLMARVLPKAAAVREEAA